MEQNLYSFIFSMVEHHFQNKYDAVVYEMEIDPFQESPEIYLTGKAKVETLHYKGEQNVTFHLSFNNDLFSVELETNL